MTLHTPKGGAKRFLTPSPVHLSSEQSFIKTAGKISDDPGLPAKSINMAALTDGLETTHMDLGDISKVVVLMKDLMFLAFKEIRREQLRDEFATLVGGAVKEATKSLNEEITNLESQNSTLHKENSNVKKSVKDLSARMT